MSATSGEPESPPRRDSAATGAALLRLLLRVAGLAALKREATAAVRATALRVGLTVAAGIFWLLVVGYLLATFTIWLAGLVGAVYACLIVAAIFAVLAVIVQLIRANLTRRPHSWTAFVGNWGKR